MSHATSAITISSKKCTRSTGKCFGKYRQNVLVNKCARKINQAAKLNTFDDKSSVTNMKY